MTDTLLAEVIERAVAKGSYDAIARTAEAMGEEWARDVLKDPTVRAQFVALAREAFARAMADLGKSTGHLTPGDSSQRPGKQE